MAEQFDNSALKQDEQVLTNLLFDFAMSTDIVVRYLEQIFGSRNRHMSHQYKRAFNEMVRGLKMVKFNYDKAFEPAIIEQFEHGGSKAYDQIRKDANCIIRLLLLITDRSVDNPQMLEKIEQLLKDLPSSNYVPENVFENFKMKEL